MNLQKPHFIKLHKDIVQTPQDHISIDLLGPYSVTCQGNSYALTAVCSLTGYLMTTPIKDKKTMMVETHLFSDIMLKFGFPRILYSDNGMKFKSKLIEHLSQHLGIKTLIFSLAAHKAVENKNLHIGLLKIAFMNFPIDGVLEWDQLLPNWTAAFSWFPTEHSEESPHLLYFGCDTYLPQLAAFLKPKLRYLGSDEGMMCLDKLKQACMLAALNTKDACSKENKRKIWRCTTVRNWRFSHE